MGIILWYFFNVIIFLRYFAVEKLTKYFKYCQFCKIWIKLYLLLSKLVSFSFELFQLDFNIRMRKLQCSLFINFPSFKESLSRIITSITNFAIYAHKSKCLFQIVKASKICVNLLFFTSFLFILKHITTPNLFRC